MAIKVNGNTVINDNEKGTFNVANPGQFSTAERNQLTPEVGDIIFNTDETILQIWNGTEWIAAGGGADLTISPVINTATLTEDNINDNAFTNETFTVDFDMVDDGTPASIKGLKGKVTASFAEYKGSEANTGVTLNPPYSLYNQYGQSGYANYNSRSCFTVIDPDTNIPRYFQFNRDQYWTYIYEYNPVLNETNQTIQSNQGGFDNYQYALPSSNGKCWTFLNNSFVGVTQDVDKLLAGEFYSGTAELRTANYIYRGSGQYLYRYNLEQTDSDYLFVPATAMYYTALAQLNENTAILVGISQISATTINYILVNDNLPSSAFNSNYNQPYYGYSSLGQANPKSMFVFDERFWSAAQNGTLYWVKADGTQGSVSLPKDSTFVCADESTNTLYAYSYYYYGSPNSYTLGTWKSTNYGASWVEVSSQNFSFGTQAGEGIGTAHNGWVTPGGLTFSFANQNNTTQYWRTTAEYTQDVVISSSDPNILDLAVNSFVTPSSFTGAPGRGSGLIKSVTDNGDGTSTVVIAGGPSYSVGDQILLNSPTGFGESTRYLVLDVVGNVSSTTATDPGFTDVGTGLTKRVTFPSLFPTGQTPDDEFPLGTTLQFDVQAKNTKGTTTSATNIITPGLDPAPKPKFGLSAFDLDPTNSSFTNAFVWYNDQQTDISATPNSQADALWRSLYPWEQKTVYQAQQSFYVAGVVSGSPRYIGFTFSGEDLQDKILEIHVYGTKTSGSVHQITSTVSNVTGGAIYNNGTLNWPVNNDGSQESSTKIHRILLDGSDDVEVALAYSTNTSTNYTEEYTAVCAYRLTDITGNELTTEYP